jgi:hypothetical protein
VLLTLYVGGAQCDEACTGGDWRHTAGAWQWWLYPVLGAFVFLTGIMTFVFVTRRRPGRAFASLAAGTLIFFSGLAWSGDDWRQSLARHPLVFGLIAVVVICGALAALLCAPASDATVGSEPSSST